MANNYEILYSKIKDSNVRQRKLATSVGISAEHLNAMLNGRLVMNEIMYQRINYWFEQLNSKNHAKQNID